MRRLLRSVLFCPGDKEKSLQKAFTLNADAVIIDLEDAISVNNKIPARNQVHNLLKNNKSIRPCAVRVNCPTTTEWGEDDLKSLTGLQLQAIVLPKVEDYQSLEKTKSIIGSHIPLWVMIETPSGILNSAKIAGYPQVDCMIFGSNDLTKELRGKQTKNREPLLYAMSHCIIAARAAKKYVLDGVHSDIRDIDGFKSACIQGRNLGFDGKTLIHPSQIDDANTIYSPSQEEIDFARKVVQAWNTQSGIAVVDGKMVEFLHYQEAIETLRISNSISKEAIR